MESDVQKNLIQVDDLNREVSRLEKELRYELSGTGAAIRSLMDE